MNPTYSSAQKAIGLIALYIALLFLLPIGQDGLRSYHLSTFEFKIIRFAVSVPTLMVWLAAFVGYATLRQYATSIKNTPEGDHFDRLASGITWLAWSLPITALIALILSSASYEWQGFHAASTIITNYSNLLLPLVAFSIIGVASRGLVSQANLKLSLVTARFIVLLFLAAGVLYCFLTFRHFNLENLGSTANPFYLPIWLMVVTVIIPYLYAWFIGLLATYEITMLSQQTHGVIYRRALQLLAAGMVTIIISSIALQYVNGIAPHTGHIVLDARLIVTVSCRIIAGIGFILLTIGALRLKKIEEV